MKLCPHVRPVALWQRPDECAYCVLGAPAPTKLPRDGD